MSTPATRHRAAPRTQQTRSNSLSLASRITHHAPRTPPPSYPTPSHITHNLRRAIQSFFSSAMCVAPLRSSMLPQSPTTVPPPPPTLLFATQPLPLQQLPLAPFPPPLHLPSPCSPHRPRPSSKTSGIKMIKIKIGKKKKKKYLAKKKSRKKRN